MDDPELKAMNDIFVILNGLQEADKRKRVLLWAMDRFDLSVPKADNFRSVLPAPARQGGEFSTFADLFNAALPVTNGDKALVAGYWLQECQGLDEFPSNAANKELQNLGHLLANITDAFNQLKAKKPALAIQVKKSGKSQQSRKLYKLTHAGTQAVQEMMRQSVTQTGEKHNV